MSYSLALVQDDQTVNKGEVINNCLDAALIARSTCISKIEITRDFMAAMPELMAAYGYKLSQAANFRMLKQFLDMVRIVCVPIRDQLICLPIPNAILLAIRSTSKRRDNFGYRKFMRAI